MGADCQGQCGFTDEANAQSPGEGKNEGQRSRTRSIVQCQDTDSPYYSNNLLMGRDLTDSEKERIVFLQAILRGIIVRNIRMPTELQIARVKSRLVPSDANLQLEFKPELRMQDGSVYCGQVNKDEERHGYGEQQWKFDGVEYRGNWDSDEQHGHGRMTLRNGNVYEGSWHRGDTFGYGVLTEKDKQHVFEGHWLNGKQDGFGWDRWEGAQQYIGQFVQSKKHGFGQYRLPDKSVYIGDFEEDQIHGKGLLKYANGSIYFGEWECDKKQGPKGIFRWVNNQQSYYGDYANDLKDGEGIYFHADGRIYCGQWKQGKQEGQGYTVLPGRKVVRKAYFKEGKRGSVISQYASSQHEELLEGESLASSYAGIHQTTSALKAEISSEEYDKVMEKIEHARQEIDKVQDLVNDFEQRIEMMCKNNLRDYENRKQQIHQTDSKPERMTLSKSPRQHQSASNIFFVNDEHFQSGENQPRQQSNSIRRVGSQRVV